MPMNKLLTKIRNFCICKEVRKLEQEKEEYVRRQKLALALKGLKIESIYVDGYDELHIVTGYIAKISSLDDGAILFAQPTIFFSLKKYKTQLDAEYETIRNFLERNH